ncbi:alpha/beta hydrolase fold domain-containing protein [uncultured Eudoraea sp.]|uniref:alpha/beta hydrolase fold domain-containing protein n=1 Tax=uncultured Eudoraea sp. TaxID=1035614 RepID=UPI0026130A80|nr:alpha/beta hydrolase fold domain-containing protein [uncultured Eudoraea sp.]
MNREITSLITLLLVIISSCTQKTENNSDTIDASKAGITLEERFIPDPDTIFMSKEFIQSMDLLRPPTKEALMNYPKNAAEWKAMQNSRDSATILNVEKLSSAWSINIEKSEINNVTIFYVIPEEIDMDYERSWFIHIHGGGYFLNAGKAGTMEAVILAHYLKIPLISIDYGLVPDHPFPDGLNDVLNAYNGILQKYPDHNLFMGGTSAGGSLALSTVFELKSYGNRLPNALFIGTPGSDVNKTGDSWYTNADVDRVLGSYEGLLDEATRLYANGKNQTDPLISPVYGNYQDFPPAFLITGTRDLLLSNTVRVDMKLREAGVKTKLVVIEGHSHADYLLVHQAPESQVALNDLNSFLKNYLE